ncbi:MAG: hypothetical protein BM562_07055 [Alphaproteobacteria bacterium MedPE-SWcel]|nr:MAG: hypothetical protein BM562_07055 [Alphaproteobacteria bacterium MedPE-SWcel]
MQESEFRKWLGAKGQSESSINSRISTARRIENEIGDLDEVLAEQKIEDLLRQFSYSTEDERNNAPNPRETGSEAKVGVGKWIEFYNRKRPHSALGGKPPAVVYWLRKDETQTDQQARRVA